MGGIGGGDEERREVTSKRSSSFSRKGRALKVPNKKGGQRRVLAMWCKFKKEKGESS